MDASDFFLKLPLKRNPTTLVCIELVMFHVHLHYISTILQIQAKHLFLLATDGDSWAFSVFQLHHHRQHRSLIN